MAYNSLLTLAWEPYELAMIIGGAVLTGSALLYAYILWKSQTAETEAVELAVEYADFPKCEAPVHPLLNNFKVWNMAILVLMVLNFGYPILQFFLVKTFGSITWGY